MTETTIDQFYADINAVTIESIFAFEAEQNARLI
jgi:hypothetical protein